MLKRNLAILIAGGLLSVQAGLAGAQTVPPSGDEAPFVLLPAQAKYFAERPAIKPSPAWATGSAVPRAVASGGAALPAMAKYLAERAARIANERTAYLDHNADGHMTASSD